MYELSKKYLRCFHFTKPAGYVPFIMRLMYGQRGRLAGQKRSLKCLPNGNLILIAITWLKLMWNKSKTGFWAAELKLRHTVNIHTTKSKFLLKIFALLKMNLNVAMRNNRVFTSRFIFWL